MQSSRKEEIISLMDAEEYRKKLEQDILDIIEIKLLSGQMDPARARSIARMVLDKLHPPLSLEQIYKVVPTLDDEFNELAGTVLQVTEDREEEVDKAVAQHAEQLIRSGKIDEAADVLKKGMNE